MSISVSTNGSSVSIFLGALACFSKDLISEKLVWLFINKRGSSDHAIRFQIP